MSNPEMEKPTEEQAKRLDTLKAQLHSTVLATEAISNMIGDLRQQLNSSRVLLNNLKGVIGKDAYQWQSRESWHDQINRVVAAIDTVLK